MSVRPELTPYLIVTNRTVDKQLSQLSSENEIRVLNALEHLALSALGDVVDVGDNLYGFRLITSFTPRANCFQHGIRSCSYAL